MTATAITDTSAAAPTVGELRELARYTTATGTGTERILGGQRVDGVVVSLPGSLVVLVGSLGPTEDSTCRSRSMTRAEGCTKAVRRKRPIGALPTAAGNTEG